MVVAGTIQTPTGASGFALAIDAGGELRDATRYDAATPVHFEAVRARADGTVLIAGDVGPMGMERPLVLVRERDGAIRFVRALTAIAGTASSLAISSRGTAAMAGLGIGVDLFVAEVDASAIPARVWTVDDPVGTASEVEVAIGDDDAIHAFVAGTGRGFMVDGDTDVWHIEAGATTERVIATLDLDRPLAALVRGGEALVLGTTAAQPVRWTFGSEGESGCGRSSDAPIAVAPVAIDAEDVVFKAAPLVLGARALEAAVVRLVTGRPFVCRE
jgi:hypothetical protein